MRRGIGHSAGDDAAGAADLARSSSKMTRGAMAHNTGLTASGTNAAGAAQRLAMFDILDLTGRLFRDMNGAAAKQCTTCSKGCQFSEGHTN